jgi:hypothetical protein
VESNGEVMKDPSLTGRMGSAPPVDGSNVIDILKRFIWALIIVSRDKPFKQVVSEGVQEICEL